MQNLDGKDLRHTRQQQSIFLIDYWTKSDGVFAKIQIISYKIYMFRKHIQVNLELWKLLMLKVAENAIVFLDNPLLKSNVTGRPLSWIPGMRFTLCKFRL